MAAETESEEDKSAFRFLYESVELWDGEMENEVEPLSASLPVQYKLRTVSQVAGVPWGLMS